MIPVASVGIAITVLYVLCMYGVGDAVLGVGAAAVALRKAFQMSRMSGGGDDDESTTEKFTGYTDKSRAEFKAAVQKFDERTFFGKIAFKPGENGRELGRLT